MDAIPERQDAAQQVRRERLPLWFGLGLLLLLPVLVASLLWYEYRHEQGAAAARAQSMALGIERQLLGRLELVAYVLDMHARHSHASMGAGTRPQRAGPIMLNVPLRGIDVAQAPAAPRRTDVRPPSTAYPFLVGFEIGAPVKREGQWWVPVARRQASGVRVSGWLDALWLGETVQGFELGADDRLNLVHDSGVLLARSHDNLRHLGSRLDAIALFEPGLRRQAQGEYTDASVIDGVTRQMSFRRIKNTPLTVLVGTATSAIVAPWIAFAATTIAVTLLLAVLWAWLARLQHRQRLLQKATEARLRQALALAELGEVEWDLDTGAAWWSEQMYRVYGRDPAEGPFTIAQNLGFIHPEDLPRLQPQIDALRTGDAPDVFEFRTVLPDGSLRWLHSRGERVLTPEGRQVVLGVTQDITGLVAAREQLRAAEAQYRYLFEHNPLPMWVFDRETLQFLAVNDAMLAHYGYTREELLGRSVLDIRPHAERAEVEAVARGPARAQRRTWTHLRKDGQALRVSIETRDIEFEGRPARLVLAQDVTEQERSEERFQLIARAATDAVWDWDLVTGVTWRSDNVYPLFGYKAGEFGASLDAWEALLHPEDRERVMASLPHISGSDGDEWESDYRLRRKDGSYAQVHDRAMLLRDADGRVTRAVGGMLDVTERQRMIEQLAYRATYDELTALPNRQLLTDRLQQAVHNAKRYDRGVGVLFVDLDEFKLINDSLGHNAGDEALHAVAQRLKEAVRETDTLGRFGGDEFVAILTEQTDESGVGRVIERITAALAEPIRIAGTTHYISASIGYCSYPEAGDDAESLLKHADLAMYQAKQQGRNRAVAYHSDFAAGINERLHMISALRDALCRKEFRLFFQPVFDAARQLVGMEALIRWQHPERGLLGPDSFIRLCEDSGFIVPIGRWVLDEAARHHRRLAEHGLGHVRIAVNVSAVQFAHDLYEDVSRVVTEHALPSGALELELTESVIMENPDRAIDAMRRLVARGVRIAVDDFGTGYSSLAYLKRLPIERLKIDRSFVQDLGIDEDDAEICASIIGLGHSLGLTIVAEGVETQSQFDWLRQRGCDELQGYLLGRPQPFDALLGAIGVLEPAPPA